MSVSVPESVCQIMKEANLTIPTVDDFRSNALISSHEDSSPGSGEGTEKIIVL